MLVTFNKRLGGTWQSPFRTRAEQLYAALAPAAAGATKTLSRIQ